MVELLWRLLAWAVSRPGVAEWIAQRIVFKEPHIIPGYTRYWWLFNAPLYVGERPRKYPWLPFSIRLVHTMCEDRSEHMHDHAWEYRDIVLLGSYTEVLEDGLLLRERKRGDMGRMRFGQYHKVTEVDPRIGAVRLQFIGPKLSTWGYRVEGKFVPWRTYHRDGLDVGEVSL